MRPTLTMSAKEDPGEATAALPPFEANRLQSIRRLEPMVADRDGFLNTIACRAAEQCHVPMAMITLLDEDEERFLACVGTGSEPIDRDKAFCAHTILHDGPTVVEDTLKDPRFANNPFVSGPPNIRFYAGAPILDAGGLPLGSLCVVDHHPREMSTRVLLGLHRLAAIAGTAIETRYLLAEASRARSHRSDALTLLFARLDALFYRLIDGNPPAA